jgi:hypothetical protein
VAISTLSSSPQASSVLRPRVGHKFLTTFLVSFAGLDRSFDFSLRPVLDIGFCLLRSHLNGGAVLLKYPSCMYVFIHHPPLFTFTLRSDGAALLFFFQRITSILRYDTIYAATKHTSSKTSL